jgi:Lrp/AsnC family transcriptional regulator, leucine-responsive regulatory protein
MILPWNRRANRLKRLRYQNGLIDAIDGVILRALSEDARMTMADLARAVGLSAPSVTERVRRLEEARIIQGYGARIDPAALGLPLAAYIRVRPIPGQLRKVSEVLAGLEAVVECDRVTGEDCFMAKAHVRSILELEAVIDEIMPYATTSTSIIQSSPVKRRLPLLPCSAA